MSDNISLSSIPPSVFLYLDEKAKRQWHSLSLAEQAHEIEKAEQEQLAWKENIAPVKEWWCDEFVTPFAAMHWWMQQLFGRKLSSDELTAYCCAEHGMTIMEAQSKPIPEIVNMLKAAYEKKIGLEPKAKEKSAVEPAAKPEASDDKMTWQEAAERMERLRAQGEPWTTQRKMKDQLGCSLATINKAIDNTPTLQRWARPATFAPKAQSLTPLGKDGYLDIVTEETPQKTEADPAEEAASRELREFIENADPATRAWFHGLQPKDQLDFLRDPDKHKRILGRKP